MIGVSRWGKLPVLGLSRIEIPLIGVSRRTISVIG